ncbi:muconolactone delta-isomerase [Aurantimicrobium minutum]|uniref:muconolactone Delta-isomerase family protein n=1 Tax=Aurantimicrobium minutum TaxID=708131 RepID=UPI002473D27B|nr:muconolactone Delta-isomerase family protein [Aurantimicrobium minutum]MDH6531901.1 muconolactone delta-isomerase [Aurantimicrobium minutum]
MNAFMVVCTFKPGTNMDDVFAVVAEEQAAVQSLQSAGRLESVKLSLGRGTVFLEVRAENPVAAATTVEELPMAKWWNLDVFPLGAPSA